MRSEAPRHSRRRRGTRALLSLAAIAGIAGGAAAAVAPSATAQPGNIVTFGDSFSANPDQVQNTLRGVPGVSEVLGPYPSTAGCLQAPDNWPHLLGEKTRKAVDDWSCTAQTSRSMLGRVDGALAAGVIRNDSTVVMAIGMNNFGGFGVLDGVNILDPANIRDNYIADIRTAADRIRTKAPDAKIVISGALPTVDRDTMVFCPVNVVPDHPAGIPVPLLRDIENWNRENQIAAAQAAKGTYVEMIDTSRGHDTCAPDQERYVAGVVDTTTPNYHMIFHPSLKGSQHMADVLSSVV
ncbi:MAG: GDSL-type esterase/lipase family protein [Corynebacterium provencense]|uniref:GDSL-type esterase/lipase family protein n=1 Tax=Corynebacterium provencense TaxID=1737425 RepID=UPI0013A67FD9|nr:GDSL-type esterase/lipase family protein [Corynebacterium provencense]MCI1257000.1 GDSL-type esterase/lipase family protein [Corynebacterium provencense]